MKRSIAALGLTILAAGWLAGQNRSLVGTITGIKPEAAEIEVKADGGESIAGKLTPDSMAQRVAPGETDLKKAAAIQVTDIAMGDRVLLTLDAGTGNVRRIVVMSAGDIARKNEADRLDWQKRGVTGIVASKAGNRITLKLRTLTGESAAVVTVDDHTSYKRYAPDSVKFADAGISKCAEISTGDQLRARGRKSEDGSQVAAEEVVFGTFLTKAGTVAAVDSETREITLKELGTGKVLLVKLTADSQLKRMPDFGAMEGRRAPQSGMPPAVARPGMPGSPPGMPGRPGGMDLSQMIEHMPQAGLDTLKTGETIVVSSTRGAKSDHLTAIMVLGNAGMLIQTVSASSDARGSTGGLNAGMGMGMGGMMGGGGLDLSSMGLGGIMQ